MLPRHAVYLFTLLTFALNAAAVELHPERVRADLGAQAVEVTVIEPHLDDPHARVTYVGIPLRAVLERYFAEQWKTFQGKILFVARDGYSSRIAAARARSQDAYLTFARADGKPFVTDNVQQNERDVPLAPFYLVWDNVKHPELAHDGGIGWPYQVVDIQLVPSSEGLPPLPDNASAAVREGHAAYQDYCMSCHRLAGVGGHKCDKDMRELIQGMSHDDLRRWIDAPIAMNPNTKMPPLNTQIDPEERERIIGRIIDYLEAVSR